MRGRREGRGQRMEGGSGSGNKSSWVLILVHLNFNSICTYHLCSQKENLIQQRVGCSSEKLGSWEQNVHTTVMHNNEHYKQMSTACLILHSPH